MAAVFFLFKGTNKAAVTSRENQLKECTRQISTGSSLEDFVSDLEATMRYASA